MSQIPNLTRNDKSAARSHGPSQQAVNYVHNSLMQSIYETRFARKNPEIFMAIYKLLYKADMISKMSQMFARMVYWHYRMKIEVFTALNFNWFY